MNHLKINQEVRSKFGQYKYDGINNIQTLYDLLKFEINCKRFIKTNHHRVKKEGANKDIIKTFKDKERCLQEIDNFYNSQNTISNLVKLKNA